MHLIIGLGNEIHVLHSVKFQSHKFDAVACHHNTSLSLLGSEDDDMSHIDKVNAFTISLQL